MVKLLLLAALLAPQDLPVPQKRRSGEVKVHSVKPDRAEVKAGETFKLVFDLEVVPSGWYVYPTTPTTTGKPTRFVMEGAEVAGRIEEPKAKVHAADGDIQAYDYHDGLLTFTVPAYLKPGPKPGPLEVRGKIEYQVCSKVCIDKETEFSFSVKVLEGQVAPPPPVSESKDAAQKAARKELEKRGLAGFLLFAMLGGLVSLVMPCVYPLIPITLTYFIKQSAGSRATGTLLSTAYSAGIVVVFTGIGFVFSLALGEDGARTFAANPWVNTAVGLLFLWFTFSLFGLYDITLPQWLVGSATSSRRSGVGGSFILGALFSVVTFTCTIPIAATILAVSASEGAGNRFVGLTAMLVYSATMAAPFFVLGMFPGLLKEVPKSGGWLHTVKVTAAFAELALALSYFAKAEQVWDLGLLSRYAMVAVWVAVLAFMALYLLRAFRMKGDEEEGKPVGIGRMLIALGFAGLAVFMGTGFIQGRSLGALEIVVVVPPEAPPAGGGEPLAEAIESLEPALAEAKKTGKPVFLEFTGKT
jgi:thiol:disulfide interchange protein DsbD